MPLSAVVGMAGGDVAPAGSHGTSENKKMTAQPTYSVFSKRTVEQISRTEHHCGS